MKCVICFIITYFSVIGYAFMREFTEYVRDVSISEKY